MSLTATQPYDVWAHRVVVRMTCELGSARCAHSVAQPGSADYRSFWLSAGRGNRPIRLFVQFGTMDWHAMVEFGVLAIVLLIILMRLLMRG
jgi:hypothetical protein